MSFLSRAAFLAALSLFVLETHGQGRSSGSETYKDIIEKAYNLSLQKDRQQAMTILGNALRKESRPQAVAELKKTISELAHVFMSDRAQQVFESGVSLRRTDLVLAQDKILEALRIEPDNISIVLELARIHIARGDCGASQELLQKHTRQLIFDEGVRLGLAQALVCQQKWLEYQRILDPAAMKRSSNSRFWLALEIEKHLQAKSFVKTQELLSQLKKADDKYPELSYWQWKLSLLQRRPALDQAQKYMMTCKNISANQFRQYMMEPMLCRRLSEVEREQKGNDGNSG